ncbi:hypothetical protein D3C86_1378830 [compost metagenome]
MIHRGLPQIGETNTRVDHRKAQRQPVGLNGLAGHPQGQAADPGELDGVIQQTFQALRDLDVVAVQTIRHTWRDIDLEVQRLARCVALELRAQCLDHTAQTEGVGRGLEFAGLQFGKGEDAVDHAHHVPRRSRSRLLILLELRVHLDRLHQLQRTDHPVHGRAQFVGQGGKEFVLELVAASQLLVEDFKLLTGVEQRLRLLLAHVVDAVGQRQGQQRHFDGRTDLAGIHGQEHVRQVAQHHQRIDDAAEQKRRPGDDEIPRHAQAPQPGKDPGGKNHHSECQRQGRGQAQGQGVAGHQ